MSRAGSLPLNGGVLGLCPSQVVIQRAKAQTLASA
jgi:hypothetical protein